MKLKKLNNKGFTLIELLAVIVILAVVMGIAGNSVLTSMNNARMGSLKDSAQVIAKSLTQKYLESQITGNAASTKVGDRTMDFSSSCMYYLDAAALKDYGLKDTDYVLNTSSTAANKVTTAPTAAVESFLTYNSNGGSFVVCLVAKSGGNYYVDGLKTTDTNTKLVKANTGLSFDITFGNNVMFACSDGTKSK